MPNHATDCRRPVTLVNEAALEHCADPALVAAGSRVILAGRSLVALTLADLAIPRVQMIWTDFHASASLRQLSEAINAFGGLDALVLAADGAEGEAVFSLMSAVLTFLPALRRRPGARIAIVLKDGPSVAAMEEFLRHLSPGAARSGIAVELVIERQTFAA